MTLDCKATVTVGLNRESVGKKPCNVDYARAVIIVELAVWFPSGSTLTQGLGQWRGASDKTEKEDCFVITVYGAAGDCFTDHVKAFAGLLKERLEQEAVAVTFTPATIAFV